MTLSNILSLNEVCQWHIVACLVILLGTLTEVYFWAVPMSTHISHHQIIGPNALISSTSFPLLSSRVFIFQVKKPQRWFYHTHVTLGHEWEQRTRKDTAQGLRPTASALTRMDLALRFSRQPDIFRKFGSNEKGGLGKCVYPRNSQFSQQLSCTFCFCFSLGPHNGNWQGFYFIFGLPSFVLACMEQRFIGNWP